MGTARQGGRKRRSITLTLDPDLIAWVEEHAGVGQEFASISHAVERALVRLRDEMQT